MTLNAFKLWRYLRENYQELGVLKLDLENQYHTSICCAFARHGYTNCSFIQISETGYVFGK